jgi:hypothetical protein
VAGSLLIQHGSYSVRNSYPSIRRIGLAMDAMTEEMHLCRSTLLDHRLIEVNASLHGNGRIVGRGKDKGRRRAVRDMQPWSVLPGECRALGRSNPMYH